MYSYDAVILTDARYVNPAKTDWYVENVLMEDEMLGKALEARGLKVGRTNWDNPDFDWASTRFVIFRSTWDYFERFPQFSEWLDRVNKITSMVNPYDTIRWNLDKHYLSDLQERGVNIPPTLFLETGDPRSLSDIVRLTDWKDMILKPVVSGAARHTYRFSPKDADRYEPLFRDLISSESMMLQEFQQNVLDQGELAFMVFGGRYSHAVRKKARPGDFRVQDDFGGSVHDHDPAAEEIAYAEKVVSHCHPLPVYARVDMIQDNRDEFCVSELELIEPELWFRKHPEAAGRFAGAFMNFIAS